MPPLIRQRLAGSPLHGPRGPIELPHPRKRENIDGLERER
ncbi:unnamed protein product [Spirodela intermedia]|uniref:Uncharacterized protein n=1 Tax=Spirodela intermedia TaxID=51605 RepID=A0A7I8K7S1_SPIIN|nr:unnamed protein product [Spirodela intermedia]